VGGPWGGPAQGLWTGQGFGTRGFQEELGQIVGTVVSSVIPMLQTRGFLSPYGFGQPYGGFGTPLASHDVGQIVSAVTPVVASLLQARAYQGHLGQMPRAA